MWKIVTYKVGSSSRISLNVIANYRYWPNRRRCPTPNSLASKPRHVGCRSIVKDKPRLWFSAASQGDENMRVGGGFATRGGQSGRPKWDRYMYSRRRWMYLEYQRCWIGRNNQGNRWTELERRRGCGGSWRGAANMSCSLVSRVRGRGRGREGNRGGGGGGKQRDKDKATLILK